MIETQVSLLDANAKAGGAGPPFANFLMFDENYGFWWDPDPGGGPFEDAKVDWMIAKLDALLTLPETVRDFEKEAGVYFSMFLDLVQLGSLDPEQTARIVAHYEDVREKHPQAAELIDRQRFLVENLFPGQVAPNIVGTDTEGVEFELEDYRGNVVVLVFSGHWCWPCRQEYPYHRGMLDIYKEEKVVLLGVNSDPKVETIREAKRVARLPYRTWWDGHVEGAPTSGPIATEWNVQGWPTTYILDEKGVIQRVTKGKSGGDIIAAVDKLLREKRMRDLEAAGPAAEQPLELRAADEEASEEEEADAGEGGEGGATHNEAGNRSA